MCLNQGEGQCLMEGAKGICKSVVCCSVLHTSCELQCVAECCRVLQCLIERAKSICSSLVFVVLQCIANLIFLLQCVA